MDETKKEKILTYSNIIFGAIIIILAVILIVYTTAAVLTLLFLLSIVIIIIGLVRLINAYSNDKLDTSGKLAKFLTAIIALIFGIIVMVNVIEEPAFAIAILVLLFNILLLLIGFARIYIGATTKEYFRGYRIFLALIGIVMIVLSLIVFFTPEINNKKAIVILSVSILLSGIARFILGLLGIKK